MKIFTQVLGLTLITNIYAFDFQDGFKKLSESLERNKKSVDIAQYLEPKESYKDDKGNTFLKYSKHVNGIRLYGEDKLVIMPKANITGVGIQASQSLSDFDVDFKMSHVDAAARLQVISSGGLPQVRLSAPGAFPGSTTRPRALADAAQGRCRPG